MRPFRQIIVAVMMLLFIWVSGADCLLPNTSMSSTEKACCQQMAGQCDNSMAAEHPCCQQTVPSNDAELNVAPHSVSWPFPLHLAILELNASLQVPSRPFLRAQRPGGPPHEPPAFS